MAYFRIKDVHLFQFHNKCLCNLVNSYIYSYRLYYLQCIDLNYDKDPIDKVDQCQSHNFSHCNVLYNDTEMKSILCFSTEYFTNYVFFKLWLYQMCKRFWKNNKKSKGKPCNNHSECNLRYQLSKVKFRYIIQFSEASEVSDYPPQKLIWNYPLKILK